MSKAMLSRYRLFSPVMVGGKEAYVTRLPKDGDDSYLVSGDSYCHSIDEIQPIPLDAAFFDRHSEVFQKVNGVYECSGNSHVVTVDGKSICSVDGKEYGYVYRHELINILDDICNNHVLLPDVEDRAQTN